MNNKNNAQPVKKQKFQTIATFGRAVLLSGRPGEYDIQGGTRADLFEAREWSSLFLHEAVFGANFGPHEGSC